MNSQVLKILIDNKSKAAFGVRLRKGDHVYTVLARKEVILSAGTLNSAQLLMLSGIRDQLGLKPSIYCFRCVRRGSWRSSLRARYPCAQRPPSRPEPPGSLRDGRPDLHPPPAGQPGADTLREHPRCPEVRHLWQRPPHRLGRRRGENYYN